jgi:hypothetical protein
MNDAFNDPELRREYHYAAHTFIPKGSIPSLQAADMLSWQTHTHRKRRARDGDKPFRKDFEALCKSVPHYLVNMTADRIIELRDAIICDAVAEAAQSA